MENAFREVISVGRVFRILRKLLCIGVFSSRGRFDEDNTSEKKSSSSACCSMNPRRLSRSASSNNRRSVSSSSKESSDRFKGFIAGVVSMMGSTIESLDVVIQSSSIGSVSPVSFVANGFCAS